MQGDLGTLLPTVSIGEKSINNSQKKNHETELGHAVLNLVSATALPSAIIMFRRRKKQLNPGSYTSERGLQQQGGQVIWCRVKYSSHLRFTACPILARQNPRMHAQALKTKPPRLISLYKPYITHYSSFHFLFHYPKDPRPYSNLNLRAWA